MNPWEILGLSQAEASDLVVVKRAYAVLLKQHRPDRDPQGFRRIRDAYEALTKGASATTRSASVEASVAASVSPAPTVTYRPPSPTSPPSADQHSPPAPASAPPLELLRLNDWESLVTLAASRWDAAAPLDPVVDLDLARCFALVDPATAVDFAQRAFQADRYAIDPWMEQLFTAGRELAGFSLADRRLAAAASLNALPQSDDPTVARCLRKLACQIAHPHIRTILSTVAANIDGLLARETEATRLRQRAERAEEERRTHIRRWVTAVIVVMILVIVVNNVVTMKQPAAEPVVTMPPVGRSESLVIEAPMVDKKSPATEEPEFSQNEALKSQSAPAETMVVHSSRRLLQQNKTATVAALFRTENIGSASRTESLLRALRRILSDSSITPERRRQLARMVYAGGDPQFRPIIEELLPEVAGAPPDVK